MGARFDEAEDELVFLSELENAFASILSELNQLAERIEPLMSDDPTEHSQHLQNHLDRYTMQSERDVHEQFKKTKDESQDSSEETDIELFDDQDDEDLGDFELF